MKVINLDQLKYIIIDQMLSAYYISFIIIIMSYLDLWDCFNEVRDHWNENREIVEEFLDLVRIRLEIEKSHCKKLDKFCAHPFFKMGKNTLIPAIEKFKSFYVTKLVNSRNLIIIMQADLIQPLRDLITNQEIKIRDKIDTVKRWDHEKKKNIKSYEMSKEKYWKACKDTLLCTKNKSDYLKKEEESYLKLSMSPGWSMMPSLSRFGLVPLMTIPSWTITNLPPPLTISFKDECGQIEI